MPINIEKTPWLLVLFLAVATQLSGIDVAFFTDDPGLYAALAKNMVLRENYWELVSYGKNWLDKPHFPFWMAALSFKAFGFSSWSYKLPALLFFLLSVFYTYLFAKKNYGQKTAVAAALILLTAQHIFMSNTDVRAEPYLMALIMGSVYHFYQLEKCFGWKDLLLGALFAGCAIMTKGVFALIPIGAAVFGELMLKKRYTKVFRWKWLLAIILTTVFILPEVYSLYIQFDRQPENSVIGSKQISGIHWFLWDSQFGRFINSGPITRPQGSKFFYLHTLIWAFAPWFFMLLYAVFITLKKVWQKQYQPEYYSICAALSMWLIFSLSGFQLPFYTNIIFPFFAIITAAVWVEVVSPKLIFYFKIIQYLQIAVLILAVFTINYFLQPAVNILFWVEAGVFFTLIIYLYKKTGGILRIFLLSCCTLVFANFYLNSIFYPVLTNYKSDISAAKYINQNLPHQSVFVLDSLNNPFQFYTTQPVQLLSKAELKQQTFPSKIIYVDELGLKNLRRKHDVKILKSFDDYPQEKILINFIWYKKRSETLE
ncbi:MAG: phospholipid carrier-dependent glycosyltransferase [Sphingobacteriaceae bacterium]|nr:MAG: phospholipid carrier-dependent glycosyltransferase [Sphingobacteriaceae bacterium]